MLEVAYPPHLRPHSFRPSMHMIPDVQGFLFLGSCSSGSHCCQSQDGGRREVVEEHICG